MNNLQINSTVTRNVEYIAYDDHHKFYLIENAYELYDAQEDGLSIYEMDEFPELWANSSSLRYLASFGKDEDGNREMIIPQCQNVTSFVINGIVYEIKDYIDPAKSKAKVL